MRYNMYYKFLLVNIAELHKEDLKPCIEIKMNFFHFQLGSV